MNCLVTGSAGHLGEALIRGLRAAGASCVGIDIKPSDFTDVVGSITDADFVDSCMAGCAVVYHAATLHKPHVATHSKQDFVDTNISGTLNLLEAAARQGVHSFVFTSTTSLFGDALLPAHEGEAVWVTEELTPVPKNIYGVTKAAAEDLCHLFHRKQGLNCLVLRTSRFFPEEDDSQSIRDSWSQENAKANEMLFRRVDIEDIVEAHFLAAEQAPRLGFGRYIISATTPFTPQDLRLLMQDAPAVVARHFPGFEELYDAAGWRMFDHIGRVYVNEKARSDLGWQPRYDFRHVLDCLARGKDFASPLAGEIGSKGYHEEIFSDGPYPVEP